MFFQCYCVVYFLLLLFPIIQSEYKVPENCDRPSSSSPSQTQSGDEPTFSPTSPPTPEWIHDAYKTLQGHHLVFLGDSLSRYQYLSLVLALKRGEIVQLEETPNPLCYFQWFNRMENGDPIPGDDDWLNFMFNATKLLSPNEHCDCYRDSKSSNVTSYFENRYYFNETAQFNISFIHLTGMAARLHLI